jgi:8-oxo-dGTP pyrophosphatase MutT (NUDIX family)
MAIAAAEHTDMADKSLPRRITSTPRAAGRFLRLDDLLYLDGQGRERRWESAGRQGAATAVLVVPVLRPSGRLVLIRQYRPPVDAYVIEFPAGLVDPGETPEQAAVREVFEETGYRGAVRWTGPQTCSSPGMTCEGVRLMLMDVDESLAANRQPSACPDEGEEIEVCLVSLDCLAAFLRTQQEAGACIDSRTAAYALGLGLTW